MTFKNAQKLYDNENESEHPNMPTMEIQIHGLGHDVTESDELIEALNKDGVVYYLNRSQGPQSEGWAAPCIWCSACWMSPIMKVCLRLYSQFFELTIQSADVESNIRYIKNEDTNG
jgi:hypothetical protein